MRFRNAHHSVGQVDRGVGNGFHFPGDVTAPPDGEMGLPAATVSIWIRSNRSSRGLIAQIPSDMLADGGGG